MSPQVGLVGKTWGSNMAEQITENIGAEYDEKVWELLKSAIAALNGKVSDQQWALAGSQELNFFEIDIEGEKIEVESETYMGISISGSSEIIKRICSHMGS